MFFAGQDPDIPDRMSLKALVTYPDHPEQHSDIAVAAALARVDLGEFINCLDQSLYQGRHWRNTLSGGHMHISRTGRQTPARWYWALEALDGTQCEALNMRHMTDTRWCELIHGDYCGKDTAINDTHRHTIEFRTFGPWHHDTAGRLDAAVHYMHAMWRFFQKFPVPKLKTRDIQAMSRVAATQAINDTNATTAGRGRI